MKRESYQNSGIPNKERREAIKEASIEAFNVNLPKGFENTAFLEYLKDLRTAFVLGALWSDAHPFIEHIIAIDGIDDLNLTEND